MQRSYVRLKSSYINQPLTESLQTLQLRRGL